MAEGDRGSTIIDEAQIAEFTTRGIAEIYPSADELANELSSGRQLHAYMGIDPTAPDMHVGHVSQLRKLRSLQSMGHQITLLIGDFTAMIGDPTDRSAGRVKLSRDQVLENAEGYKEQAGRIIDFDDSTNPANLRYNSEWLGKMDFADVLELASEFTVQQMLARSSFKNRIDEEKPVGLHEFLYPMMQGWDSVALDVDIELGGSDQIFNMLVGSELLRRHKDKQKFTVAGTILADPSGRKIGKTEGNMVTINDLPEVMFHKVMRWGDAIAAHALELCTTVSMSEIRDIERAVETGQMSGLEAKTYLARTFVEELHGPAAVEPAEAAYVAISSKNAELPIDNMTELTVSESEDMVSILVRSGLAASKSAARRLIEGGGVRLNGETVSSDWAMGSSTAEGQPSVLQVGKRKLENYRSLVIGTDK